MILRSDKILMGETMLEGVMLNLINENQIRLKFTSNGKQRDFFIHNWSIGMKGLETELVINGREVSNGKPIQILGRVNHMKKTATISGRFLDRRIHKRTSSSRMLADVLSLIHK